MTLHKKVIIIFTVFADMAQADALYIECGYGAGSRAVNKTLCGYGGIGRRAGFRFLWATVQVQLLLSAPIERGKVFLASFYWYMYL